MAAAGHISEYFAAVIEDRRRSPREDLLTFIANGGADGAPIGDAAVGMAHVIFAAAIDTTACFLNNTVYLLDRHRDQRRWLLENLDSLEPALEECLRFESPVQNAKRTVTKAVELNGSSMPQGATVAVLFGSANRDEHRYEEADRFDLQRPQQRTLVFGEGIHHCLGAPLARMEGRIAIGALFVRCQTTSWQRCQNASEATSCAASRGWSSPRKVERAPTRRVASRSRPRRLGVSEQDDESARADRRHAVGGHP